MATFGKPISFEKLIQEISSRYHLGPKGRSLVEEALDLIAEHPGGISGFLDRFKAASCRFNRWRTSCGNTVRSRSCHSEKCAGCGPASAFGPSRPCSDTVIVRYGEKCADRDSASAFGPSAFGA
jgi:hypothetical protein